MLEQIAAFLVSLTVAVAGAIGIQTASTAPHGVDSDEIRAEAADLARAGAGARFGAALGAGLAAQAEVQDGDDDAAAAVTAGAGTETALEAIADAPAWEASDGNAEFGLTTATAAVGGAHGEEADTAEVEGDEAGASAAASGNASIGASVSASAGASDSASGSASGGASGTISIGASGAAESRP